MGFWNRLFGKKDEPIRRDFSEEEYETDDEQKTIGLESVLGNMHNTVGHAIIPFAVGGAVDMYYFPNHIKGTGFATMELLDPAGNGPLKNRLGTYELVAFTKHDYKTDEETPTPFDKIERQACGFLSMIGKYSSQAVLNPKETLEVPNGEGKDNTCIVFDDYNPNDRVFRIGDRTHYLLLCMEIFESEMTYARENGSDGLFKRLREAGHYPYSDMDRDPVV